MLADPARTQDTLMSPTNKVQCFGAKAFQCSTANGISIETGNQACCETMQLSFVDLGELLSKIEGCARLLHVQAQKDFSAANACAKRAMYSTTDCVQPPTPPSLWVPQLKAVKRRKLFSASSLTASWKWRCRRHDRFQVTTHFFNGLSHSSRWTLPPVLSAIFWLQFNRVGRIRSFLMDTEIRN